MRRHLEAVLDLKHSKLFDIKAVLATLDQIPTDAGAEIAVVVEQARRAAFAIDKGKRQYKPLLRHALRRLIELLESA